MSYIQNRYKDDNEFREKMLKYSKERYKHKMFKCCMCKKRRPMNYKIDELGDHCASCFIKSDDFKSIIKYFVEINSIIRQNHS